MSITAPQQEDDIDIEINPITMLLVQEQEQHSAATAAPPDPLQHHQNYNLHSIKSTVVIRQLPSQGLSFQLWPAATTLVSLLDQPTAPLSALLNGYGRRLRILELGSGTGLVGIAAAAILGAYVTVTDLSHVVPNLKFNAEANSDIMRVNGGSVDVAALEWGEKEEMEATGGEEYDIIMGSDVVYHDHLYEPLLETLRFLLLGGAGGKDKVFVMAHLKRWKKECVFFKKAKKDFDVDVIHRDVPSNGARVGVVVYSFVGKKKMSNKQNVEKAECR